MAQCLKRENFVENRPKFFQFSDDDARGPTEEVYFLSQHTQNFFYFQNHFPNQYGGGILYPYTFFDILVSPFFNIRYILGRFCHFVSLD